MNNNLPDILTAQDIADYLRIGRKRVYELMDLPQRLGGIPAFPVGRSRRVEKSDFLQWITKQKASKSG